MRKSFANCEWLIYKFPRAYMEYCKDPMSIMPIIRIKMQQIDSFKTIYIHIMATSLSDAPMLVKSNHLQTLSSQIYNEQSDFLYKLCNWIQRIPWIPLWLKSFKSYGHYYYKQINTMNMILIITNSPMSLQDWQYKQGKRNPKYLRTQIWKPKTQTQQTSRN